jgi:hypothetical protein
MKHCPTCDCPSDDNQLTVRASTAGAHDGDCNLCDRNIGPNGFISATRRVWIVRGASHGIVRFCDQCLRDLKALTPLVKP